MTKTKIFLDSGAFSAYTRGINISIENYINFIKKHKEYISLYAVLDVVGDAESTLQNQRIMEKAGLKPIPCFHLGEPLSYLRKYVHEYEYIAIGGMAKISSESQLMFFLDDCFDIICNKKGLPKIKVHAFGVTRTPILTRYPFYSADSSSWLLTAAVGGIYVPWRKKDGSWDYLEELPGKKTQKICVSAMSKILKTGIGSHFANVSRKKQEVILDWISEQGYEMGSSSFRIVSPDYNLKEGEREIYAKHVIDDDILCMDRIQDHVIESKERIIETIQVPGLSNSYQLRSRINALFFRELGEHIPKWPWPWKGRTIQALGVI